MSHPDTPPPAPPPVRRSDPNRHSRPIEILQRGNQYCVRSKTWFGWWYWTGAVDPDNHVREMWRWPWPYYWTYDPIAVEVIARKLRDRRDKAKSKLAPEPTKVIASM